MKRLFSLMISVALLLTCASAAAESPVVTEFEDFTLVTETALSYAGQKVEGQTLFVFYHTLTGEVSTSAVSAVWLSSPEPASAAEFTAMIRSTEPVIRSRYEANGNELKSYEVAEAAEQELWGKAALVCDTEMLIGLVNSEVGVIQRSIRITGSSGTYIFSLSAFSRESLEEAADSLVRALQWK